MAVSKTTLALGFLVAAVVVGMLATRRDHFMQKDAGMPLDAPGIGPYDNSTAGWMPTERMPVGSYPQNTPLDGKIMFLVGNEVDPTCCPAAFTSDNGCVCLSEADKDFMGSRGGNK